MIRGEPRFAHATAHSRLKFVAVDLGFCIGQATSLTSPSITIFFLPPGSTPTGFVLSCADVSSPIDCRGKSERRSSRAANEVGRNQPRDRRVKEHRPLADGRNAKRNNGCTSPVSMTAPVWEEQRARITETILSRTFQPTTQPTTCNILCGFERLTRRLAVPRFCKLL